MSSSSGLTEDPYDYVQGRLDGSKTTHLVMGYMLSRCNFFLLFTKGTFKLELIPCEALVYSSGHSSIYYGSSQITEAGAVARTPTTT
jgi:hypothetical protein